MWSHLKFGLVVQEEMSFKVKGYRRMDAQRAKTDHNSSPWAHIQLGCAYKNGHQNRLKKEKDHFEQIWDIWQRNQHITLISKYQKLMMSIITKHNILKGCLWYLSADFQLFKHPSPKALNWAKMAIFLFKAYFVSHFCYHSNGNS